MWYNRLSEYLLKHEYENDIICPCIFIKKSESGFVIIEVYVDDLNLIRTPEEHIKIAYEFEIKYLGKTKFCLDQQLEHISNGIFIHQTIYGETVLKQFYMDKAHPLSTPMVGCTITRCKEKFISS